MTDALPDDRVHLTVAAVGILLAFLPALGIGFWLASQLVVSDPVLLVFGLWAGIAASQLRELNWQTGFFVGSGV